MNLCDEALRYAARGWSIIPISKEKKPALRSWKPYQTRRPTEAELREWFQKPNVTGLALICGPVSGGVTVRDFDSMAAYERWATEYPGLASTLPIAKTGRGRHVYFRSGHDRVVKFGDTGELRGAGYVLLPPSAHPDGGHYEWLVALPDGPLPEIDPYSSGLVADAFNSLSDRRQQKITEERRGPRRKTEDHRRRQKNGLCSLLSDDDKCRIEDAIVSTLPTRQGQRDNNVFELCRALKAIPSLKSASFNDLRPFVVDWHRRVLPVIGTKPFEDSWAAFIRGWDKVKHPKGERLAAMLVKADESGIPEVATQYDSQAMRRLVGLCRELQREAGGNPFYLAGRAAGQVLDVGHDTAARWLKVLVVDGILEEIEKGKQRRGTRYRYRDDVE